MSFGFQFDEEELSDEYKNVGPSQEKENINRNHQSKSLTSTANVKGKRHSLEELLSSLPPRISYSSIAVPLEKSQVTLHRRDLFDARFQLINDDDDIDQEENKQTDTRRQLELDSFAAGANTDLIPGVYEGGFKTWECALDLVCYLEKHAMQEDGVSWSGKIRVIELGCGTALPSMYLFSRLLSCKEAKVDSSFKLCDFNEQVLRLVTLPNIFLTWYFSDSQRCADEENGEVEITPEATQEFQNSLASRNITLDFYSGSWDSLHEMGTFERSKTQRNIVLTSETIYSLPSLPSLVNALELACSPSIESTLQKANLTDAEESKHQNDDDLCLVAAKMLYFGVGGGVNAFEEELQCRRAKSKTVWKSDRGVSRVVLQVDFRSSLSSSN